MSTTNKAGETITLRKGLIDLVMDYIREEQQTLEALATAIVSSVAVRDTKNPEDHDNIQALRLAELLEDRLSSTVFQENIGNMLGVNQ